MPCASMTTPKRAGRVLTDEAYGRDLGQARFRGRARQMAQKSTLGSMRAVSGLLFLAVAGLIAAGVVEIRHDYLLTGAELIGWAFVPLALLLGFTLPVKCKVKRTNSKACGHWAYGFLFGCRRTAGHWTGKFRVRIGLGRSEAKPVERRQRSANTVVLNQPASQSKPIRVTVEESALAKCGFWVGFVSGVVGIVEAIVILVH